MRRIVCLLLLVPALSFSHGDSRDFRHDDNRHIEFPDVAGYVTLVADLHTHSVFSDGHVWPRTRTEEALMDGLDALAITEHLEWQPHREDLPNPDANRAYEIARDAAEETELMVIPGAEITRRTVDAHLNALFIDDANRLQRYTSADRNIDDPSDYWDALDRWPAEEAIREANDQDAFVFWNHPAWSNLPEGVPAVTDFIRSAIERSRIHGVEIVNGIWYSEQAFDVANRYSLTLLGTSDIHELIDYDYKPYHGGHRPVTLIFAKKRTPSSMKDALFAGRTVVYQDNRLLGREPEMSLLLDASLTVEAAGFENDDHIASVVFKNHSDLRFILENTSEWTFQHHADLIEIPPQSEFTMYVTTKERRRRLTLTFDVANALIAPKQKATLYYDIELDDPLRQRESRW